MYKEDNHSITPIKLLLNHADKILTILINTAI